MARGCGLPKFGNVRDAASERAACDLLSLVLRCQALNLRQVIQIVGGERFQLHSQSDDAPLRMETGAPECFSRGIAKQP